MKRVVKWLGVCLAFSAVLLLSPWPDPATARPQAGPVTTALNVIRTFAHHELTNLNNARIGGYVPAVLSKNGAVALFQVAAGLTPATSIHIWSVGADGAGQREIDVYEARCACAALMAVSPDGTLAITSDSKQVRAARPGGGSPWEVLALDGEINAIKLAGNPLRVFMLVRRDTSYKGSPVQRGVWTAGTDGSGLRQITGPTQVGALLGVSPDAVFPFAGTNFNLDVSDDGNRIVFSTYVAGPQRAFAVNADGSGLHAILGPYDFVHHVAISGDGSKVLYDVTPPPCCSTPNEIGVTNFDGSGQRKLAAGGGYDPDIQYTMSTDGSTFLRGSSGRLYRTDGSGALQISARGGWFSTDPPRLVQGSLYLATMNGAANRFLYLVSDANGSHQMALVEMNPASLGQAPGITELSLTPEWVINEWKTAATQKARVTTSHSILRAATAVMNKGLEDASTPGMVLLDDGTSGDERSGDGIFSNNTLRSGSTELGARTVRFSVDVRESSGRRHATVVETEPFQVTDQEPPDSNEMRLSENRVGVTLTWRNQYNGATGNGVPAKQMDQYGYFWFDSASNPEVFVKVLDFGGNSYLVFHSSLSDFEYTVKFKVLRTGIVYTFNRPPGSVCGLADGTTVKK